MLVKKKYVTVKFSETKLKETRKELAVLYDISNDLTSSLSLSDILDRAILKIREHFKVDAVRIYLMDEAEQTLELVAYKGITKKQVKGLRSIPISEGFSGKAARTKSFVAQKVSDLENGSRAALLHGKGFQVVMCVPFIVKGKVVGVMNLASKRMISLNEAKVDLLVVIGSKIAVAINIGKLHEGIRKQAEYIRQKKEELEFFAYTIAHDLKNPAIGISGFARLLAEKYEDRLNDKGAMYCRQIREAAAQIETFTRDINEYIKSRKVTFNIKRTDLRRIISHLRDEVSPVLEERHIQWAEPETIPEIMADEMAMTRVFRNLIGNALKHGGKNLSKIVIGYDQNKDFHIFSVTNDGVRMKKKDCEIVFQMFRRLPSAEQTEGSGLGLSIVKEIVQAHHGEVWFESDTQNGTTCNVSISKALGR
jgi:signal transduction histidine kinase